jgi:hypothetical protein
LLAAAHRPTRLSFLVVRCGLWLSHYADIGIVRQLHHAQHRRDQDLAGPPPALPRSLHPDRLVLDEPGPRFGLLTDKLIRRGVHTSVQALENDIRAWNDNPRPFTSTKTAEEILNSLADYLAKIGAARTDKQE